MILEQQYGSGGETENYLSCYNSRNICHSEERFSVLESPSYALLDDIFGRLKLENFYNPFLWRHQIWCHNMIFWHRFSLQMIKTPIQGSVQSFGRKSSKSANLPLMTHFGALWPHCVQTFSKFKTVNCMPIVQFRSHHDRWIQGLTMHLYRVSLNLKKISINTGEKVTQIWKLNNTRSCKLVIFSLEFVNILL